MNSQTDLLDFDRQTEWLEAFALDDLRFWIYDALRYGVTTPLHFADREAPVYQVVVRHYHNSGAEKFRRRFRIAVTRLLRDRGAEAAPEYLQRLLLVAGGIAASECYGRVLAIANSASLKGQRVDGRDMHGSALRVLAGFECSSRALEKLFKRDLEDPRYAAACYTGLAIMNPAHAISCLPALTIHALHHRELINYDFVLMNVLDRYTSLQMLFRKAGYLVRQLSPSHLMALELFCMTLVKRFTLSQHNEGDDIVIRKSGLEIGRFPNLRSSRSILTIFGVVPPAPTMADDVKAVLSLKRTLKEGAKWEEM